MTFEQTPNGPQLDALTGSRFVAAYAILVAHGQAFGYDLPSWLDLAQAVSYFFVLSGFIIGYRYPTLADRGAIAAFYWARFARIWPVHFFCLLASIASLPAAYWASADAVDWSILTLQVLLLNAWIPTERFVFGFNPVAWTISVEWFFYLVYPLLLLRWTATWRWKLAGSALLLLSLTIISTFAAVPAAATADDRNSLSTLALLYGNPLARLFEFVLGMTTAMVWHRYRDRIVLSRSVATILQIALIVGIGVDLYWSGHRASAWAAAIGSPSFDWRVLTSTPLGTGACFFYAPLILLLATGGGFFATLLSRSPAVVLGESSYSLYMIQYAMLVPFVRHAEWVETWSVAQRTVVGFAAIIGASLLLWRFVEAPSRHWLLRNRPASLGPAR